MGSELRWPSSASGLLTSTSRLLGLTSLSLRTTTFLFNIDFSCGRVQALTFCALTVCLHSQSTFTSSPALPNQLDAMVILSDEGNEYEVRIIRRPQSTYFDEHVKVGDRLSPEATECERYIVGEPGQTYAVEVTIKKGFQWGKFDAIGAHLMFDGVVASTSMMSKGTMTENPGLNDNKMVLDHINSTKQGAENVGASFTFRNLEIGKLSCEPVLYVISMLIRTTADESLTDETNVLGVGIHKLASIRVSIVRYCTSNLGSPLSGNQASSHWEVQNVDAQSYKKHGIAFATRCGTSRDIQHFNSNHIDQVIVLMAHAKKFFLLDTGNMKANFSTIFSTFMFELLVRDFCFPRADTNHLDLKLIDAPRIPRAFEHCSLSSAFTTPFMESLREPERKIALNDLQAISKAEYRDRSGGSAESGLDRREWRSWYRMSAVQRKHTYEVLQVRFSESLYFILI